MAEICRSPFDNDKHYDVDVISELDKQLYDASAALFSAYSQPWNTKDDTLLDTEDEKESRTENGKIFKETCL